MASIKFFGTELSKTNKTNISVEDTEKGCVYLEIEDEDKVSWITLDLETAIYFSKQLRKSIALSKEVSNG